MIAESDTIARLLVRKRLSRVSGERNPRGISVSSMRLCSMRYGSVSRNTHTRHGVSRRLSMIGGVPQVPAFPAGEREFHLPRKLTAVAQYAGNGGVRNANDRQRPTNFCRWMNS